MKKILHIYSGNMYGGIETVLKVFASACKDNDHSFALCHKGRLYDELKASGATVFLLPAPKFSRPWTLIKARSALKKAIDELDPDLMICHAPWSYNIFEGTHGSKKLPSIMWAHDTWYGSHWLEKITALNPPDILITNSKYTARTHAPLIAAIEGKGGKHTTCYYPVTVDSMASMRNEKRKELGLDDGVVAILIASRFEEWKGHRLLFNALADLKVETNWKLIVAGGIQKPGEEQLVADLKQIAQTHGFSDNVEFLGQRSDVPELMAAADIFCQPNTGPEPFGVVYIEALGQGLPVITNAIGAAPEIFRSSDNTDYGVLTDGTTNSLTDELSRLIFSPSDRSELKSLGPQRAEHLCAPAKVDQFLASLT